jgi:hypothetical protein
MKRLCVLLCALVLAVAFGAGCASDSADGPFGPAIRDWNGENMQMRGFNGGAIPPSRAQQ